MPPRRNVPPIPPPPPPPEDPGIEAEYADPYDDMEFGAYDPTEVVATFPEAPSGTADDTENEVPPFDERYKEDFEGLMFLGALTASFSYIGHKFIIRTLTSFEYLAAARVTKSFEDTIGANRAQATVVAALCIVSVDGKQLPIPIEETDNEYD